MNKKDKVLMFKDEIGWIQNKNIRRFAIEMISVLPDYFFDVPASSTGKYHPSYSLGKGGLVRHTKGAVLIAKTLLDLEQYQSEYSEEERDIMLTALLLHDGVKHGVEGGKYSVITHPTDMVKFIESNDKICKVIDRLTLDVICNCIASHMGSFNTDRNGVEILPKPTSNMQQFVHLCDFLSSRRFLEINFDKVEY